MHNDDEKREEMIENEYTKSKIERNPAKTNKLKSETGEI